MTLFRMTLRLFSQVQVTDWFNWARKTHSWREKGRRLPRQTARKSTGGRGLPDKTNNARDNSEDGSEDGRGKRSVAGGGDGAADQTPQDAYRPLTPSEMDAYRPLTPPENKEVRLLQRLNETRVFECFFQKFGLTVRLRKPEIEAGLGNCMFLSLDQQLLLLQMLASNTFCPITHADRKVKAMIIRNVVVDFISK